MFYATWSGGFLIIKNVVLFPPRGPAFPLPGFFTSDYPGLLSTQGILCSANDKSKTKSKCTTCKTLYQYGSLGKCTWASNQISISMLRAYEVEKVMCEPKWWIGRGDWAGKREAVDAHTSAEIPQSLGLSQWQNFLILLPGHVCVF